MEYHFTLIEKKEWWSRRRLYYNNGLALAGIFAFILYAILSEILIAPYDPDYEISLFTILFQGIGYLFMMGVANIFYNLGYYIDRKYNKNDVGKFRLNLFRLGFWFSISLPFLIPLITIIQYFVLNRK